MRNQLFHIFRNTPAGRETLLTSRYFCQQFQVRQMELYIPEHDGFNMTFGSKELAIFLDRSYRRDPRSAKSHAEEILADADILAHYFVCHKFKDRDLPEIPTDFSFMTCPDVVSRASGRFGLGHVGPGHVGPAVRSIVKHAAFPTLVPGHAFVPFRSISVMFGGSELGLTALKLGLKLSRRSGLPLRVFTHDEGHNTEKRCETTLSRAGLLDQVRSDSSWEVWRDKRIKANLYRIPRDSIVFIGAAGQSAVKELTFGSMLQRAQAELPQPLLIVGPAYQENGE